MNSLIQRLPHRSPFVFVTEVVAVREDSLEALWQIDGSEPVFQGHFPGNPIVPGVLITESLAQAAGLHLLSHQTHGDHRGMLVQSEMRFRRPVHPPAAIELRVARCGGLGTLHRFEVRAAVAGAIVAEGSVVLAILEGETLTS